MSQAVARPADTAVGTGATVRPGTPVRVTVLVRRSPAAPEAADVACLSPDELDRLDGYARPADAAAFAAGRAMLRRAAGSRLACAPVQVPLDALPGRPPRVKGSPLSCSVSHGGGLVVVALAERGRLGVDVEPIEGFPIGEAAVIARDLLGAGPGEVADLTRDAAGSAADRRRAGQAFLGRWTITEAVLKAVGVGFGADPREVALDLDAPGGPILLAAPGVPASDAAAWTLQRLDIEPGLVVALAVDSSSIDLRIDRLG